MNDSKQLTDGALLTAVYIILLLIALFVPVIIFITMFLLPIPFIIFASRHDWKPSLLMFAVSILFSLMFTAGITLPLTILSGLGGIMIGSAIHKGLNAYETWARGTIGFAAGFVFVYAFMQLILQINIMDTFDEMLNESLAMSKDLINALGLDNERSNESFQLLEDQFMMLKDLIPAGIAIVSILFAFISQWVSFKVINRVENKKLGFPSFRSFSLPTSLIWIYFVAMVFTFFDLDQAGFLYIGVSNVLMLAGVLITIQGYSFIFFYAHAKKRSKALPIISIVAGFLVPFLFYLVRILGIIDLGFSLRSRISQNKK